jgi:hypothetical protein
MNANYKFILLDPGKTLDTVESHYRMLYAAGYMEEGTCNNLKYSPFNFILLLISFLPEFILPSNVYIACFSIAFHKQFCNMSFRIKEPHMLY